MSEALSDLAKLEFADGDLELMYHVNPTSKAVSWLHGAEAFSRVCIDTSPGREHVEFRMVDENDSDILEQPYDHDHTASHDFIPLEKISYHRAVYPQNATGWIWCAVGVPLPATMNTIAERQLIPLGAHDLKLGVLAGDGEDKLFTSLAMVRAIAEGCIPVSATARHFRHDMQDHSLGLLALHAKTMGALRNVCRLTVELETDDPLESTKISDAIVGHLDYYTYERFFVRDEIHGASSTLLTKILSDGTIQDSPFKKKILNAARESKLNITREGEVMPDRSVELYYELLRKLFAGSLQVVE